jgi:hypothetical protein
MRLGKNGFGSIEVAPVALVEPGAGPRFSAPTVPLVASDVARFVRIGQTHVGNPGADLSQPRVCTMEAPAQYRGRIVLVDGCLRLRSNAPDLADAPVVEFASGLRLFRDSAGYLSLGDPLSPPAQQLRVGEPEGLIGGLGCSMDGPFAAEPDVARACGVRRAVRIASVGRVPVCTPALLAGRRRAEAEQARTQRTVAAAADRCAAQGRSACPPRVAPPAPPDAGLACRMG